ncbi:amylo-alpha-1,6-glucosidase [Dyadobacter sp. BHUBP1]|uniref:amylo-alpha-1,6-glucosidase n=1 Tax=Dyadobacter sp. BHUBP1 TaxID=3424178 RepID=UPI003D3342ED
MEDQIASLNTIDISLLDDRTQVLNYGDTFAILNRSGDATSSRGQAFGIYHRDTRYISGLSLWINGVRPRLLGSSIKEENEILSIDLTNPTLALDNGLTIEQGQIHVRRSQFLRSGHFYEKIQLQSFAGEALPIKLALRFSGDFLDIFEVRGIKREKRGLTGTPVVNGRTIILYYDGLDGIRRTARVNFPRVFEYDDNIPAAHFNFELSPGQAAELDYSIHFHEEHQKNDAAPERYKEARSLLEPGLRKTSAMFPRIETSNEQFTHWLNRSKIDLISLLADTPQGKYPYAGVPWYNTAFGRDGLITALQTLWAAPDLARDVLFFLASRQASGWDSAADAEPGKIMHETRNGEMVALNEVPFRQYYGSIDSTPLFVVLAGKYYERTADKVTIETLWPNIRAALEWIDHFGDLDGDGFLEYQHKAENGLTNQAWKDSFDSVFYDTGELAAPPIAMCEVQGYVYAARIKAAILARVMREPELATRLEESARKLKAEFHKRFWDEALQCYVLALDGDKKPCRIKSSNAGQLLYTGIVPNEFAAPLANTLLKPDMFSGWGLRTVSTESPRYNPMSYHNGSVWPHDVSLVAMGMANYGLYREAQQLATSLFDASLFLPLQRLPELYCGFERRKGEGPTPYPVACSPQAWSVAAAFQVIEALLLPGFSPSTDSLTFHADGLPDYLDDIRINGLRVGRSTFQIIFRRESGAEIIKM